MMDKIQRIKQECLLLQTNNPFIILNHLFSLQCVSMHGPEHHFLDGAALLTALHNHGCSFSLQQALDELEKRSSLMPGGTCGKWGICGSVSSLGAALSILHETGPLSSNLYYKQHMHLTSKALLSISEIGGPRCCKRNAYLSMKTAVSFIKEFWQIELPDESISCNFSLKNTQCIKTKCPFHRKLRVAFVCVHNSCRSQMAEALCRKFASDVFDVYSAGTETKPQINQDAVRLIKEKYGLDMSHQYSKLISDLPEIDLIITMGCNVQCPVLPCQFKEDWGLEDPSDQSDEVFLKIISEIEKKVHQLKERFQ